MNRRNFFSFVFGGIGATCLVPVVLPNNEHKPTLLATKSIIRLTPTQRVAVALAHARPKLNNMLKKGPWAVPLDFLEIHGNLLFESYSNESCFPGYSAFITGAKQATNGCKHNLDLTKTVEFARLGGRDASITNIVDYHLKQAVAELELAEEALYG